MCLAASQCALVGAALKQLSSPTAKAKSSQAPSMVYMSEPMTVRYDTHFPSMVISRTGVSPGWTRVSFRLCCSGVYVGLQSFIPVCSKTVRMYWNWDKDIVQACLSHLRSMPRMYLASPKSHILKVAPRADLIWSMNFQVLAARSRLST